MIIANSLKTLHKRLPLRALLLDQRTQNDALSGESLAISWEQVSNEQCPMNSVHWKLSKTV